ncbi:DUF5916 domain-containing protein [Gammaproteobacteria bacterium]|nr:DUF5916 domain-containing protein [Gammaproteobacteria bacterium]
MHRKLTFSLLLLVFCSLHIFSLDLIIDGKLDEKEWSQADEITKYYESMPFTLDDASGAQKVLVLEDEKGIYFGFITYQSNESIRTQKHQRDDEMANADMVGVSIDFDGDGLLSYGFSVSAGGSILDNVVRNENEVNYDWDSDWGYGTSIGEGVWYAEIFIPWSIAPMKSQQGDKRKVKLSFYRWLRGEFKVNTTIKGNPRTEKFLSLFNEYEFNNYSVSKLDFFPYINLTEDRVLAETNKKAGAEIFWKIDAGKQLNVALNPDFGQVESDELVVNFTSSETFYSDKRPFFSENHSLFDVKGYTFFYLINTRRIGASPDYNCSSYADSIKDMCESSQVGISDIDYAVRYTQQNESIDFGFLGASEADEQFSQGRDFYSVRARKNTDNLSVGYIGTYTERPVLDREAEVHAVDVIYNPTDKIRTNAVFMTSSIDQGLVNPYSTSGEAFRLRFTSSPKKGRWHDVGLFYFDENIDINDMGYQMLNNWMFLGAQNGFKFTDFDASSIIQSNEFEFGLGVESNADLDKSWNFTYLTYKSTFKNTSFFEFTNFYRTSGKDFWITRNNIEAPYIKRPENYGSLLNFKGPSQDFFNYFLEAKREKGSQWASASGFATSYATQLEFAPSDNINFSLYYQHLNEDGWVNWIQDNLLGVYAKKQRTTVAGFNWFVGDKHELRIKAQMVSFLATNPQAVLGDSYGDLNASDIALTPINLSDLAFQIRYRYEIMPLAYLYAVYSKGGRIVETDEEDDLGKLYQRPWNDPQADNFTLKVRYRF